MPESTHSNGQIDINDTGSFESLDNGMVVESETDASYGIYGLDTPDHGIDLIIKRRRRKKMLFILVDVLVVCFICNRLIGFPSVEGFLRLIGVAQDTSTQAASAQGSRQTPAAEGIDGTLAEDSSTVLTADELLHQACNVTFDGNDLSLPEENVSVEVSEGRVQVTHTPTTPVTDAAWVAGNAAMRAAAFCGSVGASSVQGDDESAPTPFANVTWIVRNPQGEAFLVVCFDAGSAPTTGDGIAVLGQSPRYQLSSSIYSGLANTLPQSAGAMPTLLTGEPVDPTAMLAQ